jgi:serine protein kinase
MRYRKKRMCLVVNPFMVLNELESGLKNHALIGSEERKREYRDLIAMVKQEYEDIVKNEVQRAISADEDAISKALWKLH